MLAKNLAAPGCTGKNVFIGFSVHNDWKIGALGAGGAKIFLFQRAVHRITGHVDERWTAKKFCIPGKRQVR
jgi:hypothetical protein